MKIYWENDYNALKTLIKKYAGNKDVRQVGRAGWEIILSREDIVMEIKKYCRYRSKKVIIYEIEELEDEIEGLGDEIYERYGLEDELDELEEELDDKIDIDRLQKLEDFYNGIILPEDLPDEEDLLLQYHYPEFRCDCADECEGDCEENYIHQKMIEELILEGRYVSDTYASERRQERENMDRYY